MDTSNLIPGYVHQGFCKAHQRVAVGCGNGEQIIGKWAKIPAKIIDNSLTWVECPIRTIEDVALTAINIVGATLNKGCRRNLKFCFTLLRIDIREVAFSGLIIHFPLLLTSYLILEIATALFQPFEKSHEKFIKSANSPFATKVFNKTKKVVYYDYQVQYDKNDQGFHFISLIRKHGFDNIRKLVGIFDYLDPKDRMKFSGLSSIETTGLEDFLNLADPKMKEIQTKKRELAILRIKSTMQTKLVYPETSFETLLENLFAGIKGIDDKGTKIEDQITALQKEIVDFM